MLQTKAVIAIIAVVVVLVVGIIGAHMIGHSTPAATTKPVVAPAPSSDDQFYSGKLHNSPAKGY